MDSFTDILKRATREIPEEYFKLPIYGGNNADIYRERVYCYELYHQLRNIWPTDKQYRLCGEIDKRAHPTFSEATETPDFLIHRPGYIDNYAIIEVKPSNFRPEKLKKDFKTIYKFMNSPNSNYSRGICLIYGNNNQVVEKIERAVQSSQLDLTQLEVWKQDNSGEEAYHLNITGTKWVNE